MLGDSLKLSVNHTLNNRKL